MGKTGVLAGMLAVGVCLVAVGGTDVVIDGRKVNVFAHRGGRHEFDENTMFAFKSSYEGGIRGYETDVRMTKDGHLVIIHNSTVNDRYAPATGRVEDMTIDEIRALRTVKGNPMPTVEELCEFLSDKPGMYVEFEMKTTEKNLYPDERLEEYCRKLHDLALAKKPAESVYLFTSFDQRTLKKMGELFPDSERMLIVGRGVDKKVVEDAKALGIARIAAVNNLTTANSVKEAKKAGMRVSLWPGDTIERVRLSFALGADDACTDIPIKVLKTFSK